MKRITLVTLTQDKLNSLEQELRGAHKHLIGYNKFDNINAIEQEIWIVKNDLKYYKSVYPEEFI